VSFLRRLVTKTPIAVKTSAAEGQLAEIEARLRQLESRVQNRRWAAVEETADYLCGAKVPGDYIEFGVYKGVTFSYATKVIGPIFTDMRFIAVDSFAGLPSPRGIDNVDGYTSNFSAGLFACSREQFEENLRQERVDMARVEILEGWFDEILTDGTAERYRIDKIAAAWIDCDLYESTVPVLRFLTGRLSLGSILLFDDWRVFRNLPDYGEQRACREWLDVNPQYSLRELFSFGHHGVALTVTRC
jgi:hypothetical protein